MACSFLGIIGGGARAQDRMLDTAEVLRTRLGYRGYLHLKIMPGAEQDQLTAPCSSPIASRSTWRHPPSTPEAAGAAQVLRRGACLPRFDGRRTSGVSSSVICVARRWPSTTTQFVVGPAGESDLDLLSLTAR